MLVAQRHAWEPSPAAVACPQLYHELPPFPTATLAPSSQPLFEMRDLCTHPPPDACRKGRCCCAAAAAGLFAGQLLSAAAAALVPYALSSVLPLALTAALQSFPSPVSTLVACLGPYVHGTQHCILSLKDSMMDYTRVHPLLSPTYWQRDASLLARPPGTLISSLRSIPSPFFHSVQRTPPFCSCSACTNLWGAGCLPPRISV